MAGGTLAMDAGQAEQARRKSLGQYFTPHEVVRFLFDAVPARPYWRVIDPACGDGAFLREALARGFGELHGWDLDEAHLRRCAALLAAVQPAAGAQFSLQHLDALRDGHAWAGRFDLAVGNPPFRGIGNKVRDLDVLRRFELPARLGQRLPERGVAPELLFLELFTLLARPGGWIAVVVPEGLLANVAAEPARRLLDERCEVHAAVSLPAGTFARAGTQARSAALVCRRRDGPACTDSIALAAFDRAAALSLHEYLQQAACWLAGRGHAPPGAVRLALGPDGHLPAALLQRLDPGYWHPRFSEPLAVLHAFPDGLLSLGEVAGSICYGAIRPGRPPRYEGPDGVWYIGQRELRHGRVDVSRAQRVVAGGPWDPVRARLAPGDLLLARSGVAGVGTGRMALWDPPFSPCGLEPDTAATVSCFVDRVRLRGYEPALALLFLQGRYGQAQIQRLINGVGTPNLSFSELRSLKLPRLTPRSQTWACQLRERWREAARCASGAALAELVRAVEQWVEEQ
jgi:predicted RNA methylase